MERNIELELRAEVSLNQFKKLLADLNEENKLLSRTKRLSVMFLGEINRLGLDMRIRISSDGKAELVIKKGRFHAHDRTEFSQEISKNQFMGLVRILSLFKFKSKVTERENFVFDLGNGITLVLVKAGSIAYVEVEKMSHDGNRKKNKAELLHILTDRKLKRIKNGEGFRELCNRLTKYSDWEFDGSPRHMRKLSVALKSY